MELGFVEFVVLPFWRPVAQFEPSLAPWVAQGTRNSTFWRLSLKRMTQAAVEGRSQNEYSFGTANSAQLARSTDRGRFHDDEHLSQDDGCSIYRDRSASQDTGSDDNDSSLDSFMTSTSWCTQPSSPADTFVPLHSGSSASSIPPASPSKGQCDVEPLPMPDSMPRNGSATASGCSSMVDEDNWFDIREWLNNWDRYVLQGSVCTRKSSLPQHERFFVQLHTRIFRWLESR